MEVKYLADGLDDVFDTLSDWETRIEKGDGLENISKIVIKSTLDNYEKKYDYREWPERKYLIGTPKEKQHGWPILVKTGTKRKTELSSLAEKWVKITTGFIKEVSSTKYGRTHQYGLMSKLPNGKIVRIPVRKGVWLQPEIRETIQKELSKIFGKK
jgi:phage gpG-like protein